jgi:hypothetical protein
MNGNIKRLAEAPTAETETYVGPEWIREGRNVDEPMKDGQERRAEAKRVWQKAKREMWHARIFSLLCNGVAVLVWVAIALYAMKAMVDAMEKFGGRR